MLLYIYIKKVRVLKQSSTKANAENLKSTVVENRETIDKTLIAITEKNPTEFITEFNTAYPYFKEKLTSISNNITDSEIEICAYLKLNLTTKDIARIKNLEPKTIQNRKYRIRKKLNVPNETDIYFYFNIF